MTLGILELLLFGIGFWMLAEGLVFSIGADWMKGALNWLISQPSEEMSRFGLISAAIGLALIYGVLRF